MPLLTVDALPPEPFSSGLREAPFLQLCDSATNGAPAHQCNCTCGSIDQPVAALARKAASLVCCALSEYDVPCPAGLAWLAWDTHSVVIALPATFASAIPLPSARAYCSAAYRRQYHCVLHYCCPRKYTSSPVLHARIRNHVSLETSSSSEGRSRKVTAEARRQQAQIIAPGRSTVSRPALQQQHTPG